MYKRFSSIGSNAFVAVCLMAVTGSAQAQSKAVKDEIAKMGGKWSMVSAERDGQPVPEFLVKTGNLLHLARHDRKCTKQRWAIRRL